MTSTRSHDADGPDAMSSAPSVSDLAPAAYAGTRVLIVDDYPDSAASSEMLLSLLGCNCRIAQTGQEALEVAAAFDPDLVLLDIGLPDISGYEVAHVLRTRQGDRPLFLAAITGWGQPQDRVRALAAGFDLHVLKPTNAATLKQIVQRALTHCRPDEPSDR
jgi:CheY-like chemotaxis protein